MSTFNQRHYEVVAQAIRKQYDEAETYALDVGPADGVFALQELVKDLCVTFEADNPRFKPDLFRQVALGRDVHPAYRDGKAS